MNKENSGKVSFAYTYFAIIFALVALVYVGVTLLTDTDLISYENVYYMLNDLNITATSTGEEISEVEYDIGEGQTYGEYRGGLVILNSDTVTAFSAKGKRTLYKKSAVDLPRLCTSDEYLASFSQNGRGLNIYNSFSLVITESDLELIKDMSDYSITDLALADNGMFAVALDLGVEDSCVLLYNKRGELYAEYRYTDFITDVSLSQDGRMIAMSFISSNVSDGVLTSGILIYDTDKTEYKIRYVSAGSIAYAMEFTSSGDLIAVYGDKTVVYDRDEDYFESHPSPRGMKLDGYEVNRHGCVLTYRSASSSDGDRAVTVFDNQGNRVYNLSTGDSDAVMYDDYYFYNNCLYCVQTGRVDVINTVNGDFASVSLNDGESCSDIIPIQTREGADVSFILCSGTKGRFCDAVFLD